MRVNLNLEAEAPIDVYSFKTTVLYSLIEKNGDLDHGNRHCIFVLPAGLMLNHFFAHHLWIYIRFFFLMDFLS